MTEDPGNKTTGSGPEEIPGEDNWQAVGKQFQELGDSLAQAFRTAWENEENQRRMQDVRTGLESMLSKVGQAIDDTAKSPQGQKVKEEAERTVEALRIAGEQTVQEVRPQLIDALQQLNNELQKLVERMEKRNQPPDSTGQGPNDNV